MLLEDKAAGDLWEVLWKMYLKVLPLEDNETEAFIQQILYVLGWGLLGVP